MENSATNIKSTKFNVGDIVKSKINKSYDGTYVIVLTKKTVCWVRVNKQNFEGYTYKNIPYNILEHAE